MAQDINKALETLEQNLKDIDSARKQVEDTIKASNDLQNSVSEYTAAVKSLCISLRQMGTDWDSRGRTILDDFERRGEYLSSQFLEKTDEGITRFTEQNNAFTSTTGRLSEITEELSSLRPFLESSQNSQGAILSEIRTKIDSFTESQTRDFTNLSNSLESSQSTQEVILSELNSLSHNQEQAFSQVSGAIGSLNTEQLIAFDKLESHVHANSEKMDNLAVSLDKKQRTSILMTIINIILIIALIALIVFR